MAAKIEQLALFTLRGNLCSRTEPATAHLADAVATAADLLHHLQPFRTTAVNHFRVCRLLADIMSFLLAIAILFYCLHLLHAMVDRHCYSDAASIPN